MARRSAVVSTAAARVALALLLVGLVACGDPSADPRCAAQRALRDAIRAVELAESAERSGDPAAVRSQIDEASALVRLARASLGGADPSTDTDGPGRRLLEAANYLEFIAGDFAATGKVDGTLAQFASREVNAAGSTAGGPPLNC